MRETWEEAGATVEVISPFAQLDIPLIGQVKTSFVILLFHLHITFTYKCLLLVWIQTYVIFLARLKNLDFAPGPESLECRLFGLDDIPFDSLAFSSIYVTLNLVSMTIAYSPISIHYISKLHGLVLFCLLAVLGRS